MSTPATFALALLVPLVIAALLAASVSDAAYCNGRPKDGARYNELPFHTSPPRFLNSTKNGKLFIVGDGDGRNGSPVHVLHVYGTPYEMGYAHGELLKPQLRTFIPGLYQYMGQKIREALPNLPEWLKKIISEKGLDFALDLTHAATVGHTGKYFFDELRGIADASGLDYKLLRRIHLVGELTKGDCSMFGAFGRATVDGRTIQLRSFDWDMEGPFKNHPLIVVYHPNADGSNGHVFANVGFVGWIGSFSGMSSAQLGISEIGVSYPDETFGKESRFGVPFTYLLRDMLQFDKTLDDSLSRMQSVRRTCNLILGVGDGKAGTFRSIQYGHSVARVIDDVNLLPKNDTWHPPLDNVVYHGMDWLCPPFSITLHKQLKEHWGSITAESAARYIVPITTTGNLQVCIYDLTNKMMLVSYARPDGAEGDLNAYDRRYIQLDMEQLFAEGRP